MTDAQKYDAAWDDSLFYEPRLAPPERHRRVSMESKRPEAFKEHKDAFAAKFIQYMRGCGIESYAAKE